MPNCFDSLNFPITCFDVFLANVQTGQIELVTRSSAGVQANANAHGFVDISRDGRYVVYNSPATNLAADNNPFCADTYHPPECEDVFLYDHETGATTLISKSTQGQQGNKDSYYPAISGDGRYIAYLSLATNLAPGADGTSCGAGREAFCSHIFRYDRTTGETILVDANPSGVGGNDFAGVDVSMNEDGRYVAFSSYATDLVPGFDPRCDFDGDNQLQHCTETYVRDMLTGQTAIASVNQEDEVGDGTNNFADLTPDGREIAFSASSNNLSDDDTATCTDSFSACYDVFYADATHYGLGDVNCDGRTDPLDTLALVTWKAGPDPLQYAWCPEIGTMAGFPSAAMAPQGGVLRLFGDLNCNGVVDLVDAIGVLRFYSYLDFAQQSQCPPLGRLPDTTTPLPTGAPTPTPTNAPNTPTPTPATGPGTHTPTPTPSPLSATPTPQTATPTATPYPVNNDCANLNTPQEIPDGSGYSTITFDFPESHEILYMAICINISHSYVGDLLIQLQHESGTSVVLVDHIGKPAYSGNCSGHGGGLYVLLDDYESQTLQQHCTSAANSQFQGAFKPDEAMSAFAGENIHGHWTLFVSDDVADDTGVILGGYLYYYYNP